jgi:hypothetical protein
MIITLEDAERRHNEEEQRRRREEDRERKNGHAQQADLRPHIKIIPGELPRMVTEAEQALIASHPNFYQWCEAIHRPIKTQIATADGGETIGYRLAPVRSAYLVERLTRVAAWQKYDGRRKKWVDVDCPLKVAETYLEREGEWKMPRLTGVITAPTLRPDGTILDTPGYDDATGLLFEPDGMKFPVIAAKPTRSDAAQALDRFRSFLSTFPFVSPTDLAVMLSAILTALIRRSLPTAPLHAFTAPVAGSGKSLLVDIVATIATGNPAPVITQGKTSEEMEKRLGTALLDGDAIVSIDNCESPLGGDLLCQCLTQRSVKVRVLGQSAMPEVLSSAAFLATGNNLRFAGDLPRRTLLGSLDPNCERPELREFNNDPLEICKKERGTFVAAGLTILRAYEVADRPKQVPALGSFVPWSRRVRDALLWLGEPDPCDTIAKARTSDEKLRTLAVLLEQWEEIFGHCKLPLRDVINRASEQDDDGRGSMMFRYPDLREALLTVAGDGGGINNRRLGKFLSTYEGRIVEGRRIVQDEGRAGVAWWRLEIAK